MRIFSTFIFIIAISMSAVSTQAAWESVDTGTLSWLYTIDFSSPNVGWAGGSKGTLLKTTDGGDTWVKIKKKITNDSIKQIDFINAYEGWILCHRNIYASGSANGSYLLHTMDGGENWEQVEIPRPERITKMFFSSNGFGLAIGEFGMLLGIQDNGVTWDTIDSPMNNMMIDGEFLNETNVVTVGGGGSIYFSQDAGVSWNRAMLSGAAPTLFYATSFANDRLGLAVGAKGAIFQSRNAGKSWRKVDSGTKRKFTDVVMISPQRAYAIGEDGMILVSNSGGSKWYKESSGTSHRLESMDINGNDLWVVGFGGSLLRGVNLGAIRR